MQQLRLALWQCAAHGLSGCRLRRRRRAAGPSTTDSWPTFSQSVAGFVGDATEFVADFSPKRMAGFFDCFYSIWEILRIRDDF